MGKKVVLTWNCSQQGLSIILRNGVMISGRRHYCWLFQMYSFSPIILERRQKSLWLISPKLSGLINSSKIKINKTCIFDGVNCPFKSSALIIEREFPSLTWDLNPQCRDNDYNTYSTRVQLTLVHLHWQSARWRLTYKLLPKLLICFVYGSDFVLRIMLSKAQI